MVKIKNTGKAPRGFIDEEGTVHTVQPGDEAEFNMNEADHEKLTELLKKEEERIKQDPLTAEDPPPFEMSGGAGGSKKPDKEKDDKHDPKAEADKHTSPKR